MNYFITYIIVDSVASLLVLGLLYSKRDLIKARLRAWLEVPTLSEIEEEDFDEESEYDDYESARDEAYSSTYINGGL